MYQLSMLNHFCTYMRKLKHPADGNRWNRRELYWGSFQLLQRESGQSVTIFLWFICYVLRHNIDVCMCGWGVCRGPDAVSSLIYMQMDIQSTPFIWIISSSFEPTVVNYKTLADFSRLELKIYVTSILYTELQNTVFLLVLQYFILSPI